MASKPPAISWIIAVASQYDATAKAANDAVASFEVDVRSSDSSVTPFRIVALTKGDQVFANEADPRTLPAFCPERHINPDGSFCLSWPPDVDLSVVDEASAATWWTQVLVFLRHQVRAERRGVWPGPIWAHGDAAIAQRVAEAAAASLAFNEALAQGRLELRRLQRSSKRGEPLFLLLCDGNVVCSYWGEPLRIINRRRRCPCPKGDVKRHRRLRTCGTHAEAVVALGNGLYHWQQVEKVFWSSLAGQPCCGTMKQCPLRIPSQIA